MSNQTPTKLQNEQARFLKWTNSDHYKEQIQKRLEINDSCERNKTSQALAYNLCKEDVIFFINYFGWTFDPRPSRVPHHLPFIMFPFQEDAVRWIVNKINTGEDGIIEKSRDMGATWLFVWIFYWYWLFGDSFSGLIGSYKEALVDNRTLDSLYGKLDYCIQGTPKWMLPARFSTKDHRNKLKLVNPQNYNLIAGDTMNPDFSRGARKNVVFMDEGASWEYFDAAWMAAGDSTPCRLSVSTPKGKNAFYMTRESGVDVLTLHWKLHPFKDATWYTEECDRRTDEEVAQELDISYSRSTIGRVYPEWANVVRGHFPYEQSRNTYVSWDFGLSDDTSIIWWQVDDNGIILVDAYSNRSKLIDWYIPFITGVVPSDTHNYTKRDLEVIESHRGWQKGTHFGDPAGRFRNQITNTSVIDVLKTYGIIVNFREEAKDFQTRRTETKLLLKNLRMNENEGTQAVDIAMENASYPSVTQGGMEVLKSVKPKHDRYSHIRSSVEYFAVNYNKLVGRRARVFDKFPKKINSAFPKKRRSISY